MTNFSVGARIQLRALRDLNYDTIASTVTQKWRNAYIYYLQLDAGRAVVTSALKHCCFCMNPHNAHTVLTSPLFSQFPAVKSATGVANAVIPTFTTFQYPPTLRTRAMGIANFSAGFALVTVPYIWLLVSLDCKIQR